MRLVNGRKGQRMMQKWVVKGRVDESKVKVGGKNQS